MRCPANWSSRSRRGSSKARHLSDADQFLTPQGHALNLLAMLTSPSDPASHEAADPTGSAVPDQKLKSAIVRPRVLLSTLTPRDISGSGDEGEEVFWRRFRQLESLLMAARELEQLRADDRDAAGSRLALAAIELARDAIRATKLPSSSAANAASSKQARDRLTKAAREWLRRVQGPPAVAPVTAGAIETAESVAENARRLAGLARDLANLLADRGTDTNEKGEQLRGILLAISPLVDAIGRSVPDQTVRDQAFVEAVKTALANAEAEVELAAQDVVAGCEARAILPLVVIDSLNMFGPSSLSRNHVYQLFQLFKRYDRIGVFIVETGDEHLTRLSQTW